VLVYSPVHKDRSPTSQQISPDVPSGQQQPVTENDQRDRPQLATSSDLQQQQQVRVASRQSTSGGGSGGVVRRPAQYPGAKGRLASDESGADVAARKVRTVVYDDDHEEWNKATEASKRRNNTTAEPRMSQVSVHSYNLCLYFFSWALVSPWKRPKSITVLFLSEKKPKLLHRCLVTSHKHRFD